MPPLTSDARRRSPAEILGSVNATSIRARRDVRDAVTRRSHRSTASVTRTPPRFTRTVTPGNTPPLLSVTVPVNRATPAVAIAP